MRLKNPVCHKFDRLMNNEIAAGQMFDFLTENALKNQVISAKAKESLGFPPQQPLTMYDFAKESVNVLNKLRFIYLLTLSRHSVKNTSPNVTR
jgi:hypothetical protein